MVTPARPIDRDPLELVVTNGVVVDPGMGVHARLDVGVRGDRIAAVGPDLPRGPDTRQVDAGGRYVTPGLIDLHTHLFDGISQLGVAADATCLPAGVTTAVDAGTAGEIAFAAFAERWLRPALTRTFAFINLSSIGLMLDDGLEFGDSAMRYINPDRVVEVIEAHPDVCLGIKVRMARNQSRFGDAPLTTALEATERTGTRLMVHITEPGLPLDAIFDRLRPGDIVTHLFHGRAQTVVDDRGRVLPSLRRARERGVRMDIGHGGGSFAFAVARAALADGFAPDTISTDLHTFSLAGTMRDLPTTMSKFLALGQSLDDVVRATTVEAARSLGRPEVTGRLGVGDVADIAILEDVPGTVTLEDTKGERITAERQLRPWATIRAGRVVVHGVTTAALRPAPGVKLVKNVRIPMSDGVRLAADLYLPDDGPDGVAPATPLPVVMDYIPYRKDEVNPSLAHHYLYLARHGYILARVDIRGTGASEGFASDEYTPQETADGAEAVEWLARQPWCDGHVNVMGISYGGFTALQIAALAPPHLTSIIPVDFTDDRYTDDCHYRGGLLRMYYDIGWYGTRMIAWNAMPPDPEWSLDDWADVWLRHIAENEPYLLHWLRHQTDGPYWRNGSVGDGAGIACPAFLIGGWRDGYPNPPLRLYRGLASRGLPVKVLVGPWNHALPDAAIPGPRIDYLREVVRWLDHWCKGASNGVMDEPPVVVYMQASEPPVVDRLEAAGEWRAERAWPAPGATERVLHLAEHGCLSESPSEPAADSLVYHPAVGVTGGLWSGGIQFGLPGDQRPDEALSLVYTSEPLAAELAILGWARADLVLESTATVIGFAVSLSDVAPDGSSHLVARGMLNVTRRTSLTEPEPLTAGEPTMLAVNLDCTGWIFAAGHRVRIAIANGDFPNVWPTPQPATSRVLRGPDGSRITLPVVPRSGSATPPAFAPSPLTVAPHGSAIHPPTWQVRTDVLTGRVTSDVRVDVAFRASPDTVIEREFAAVSQVDPADPAHASAHGWHVNRSVRPNQTIQGRCDTVIQSTATHFHVTIDLEVRVNEAVHATRHWAESIERRLL